LATRLGIFTTPMAPGRLGGGPAIALSCPIDSVFTDRLIVISTTGGLVWIHIITMNRDAPSLQILLSSIQVLQPGPTAGWYDPTPALKTLPPNQKPCVTDTVEATLGIATR
jgi:hypothetical protein